MRLDRHLILSLVLVLAGPALGQPQQKAPPDDNDRRQVLAAVDDGIDALRRDVYATPFSTDLTIHQAARRLEATDPLDRTIQSAEQRGVPRWREDRQVCEVRLELPGTAVASVIQEVGAKQFGKLGLNSDAFARALEHLRTQRFAAIGVGRVKGPGADRPASGTAAAQRLVPREPPAWVARQMDADGQNGGTGLKGARDAETVAHAQLRRQIDGLELSPNLTLAEAAKRDPRIASALAEALSRARISRVTYGPRSVEVRVTVDLDWVWRALAAID